MNELSSLIKKYQTLRNIKRSELAKKLGYKKVSKALRRLDAFINSPIAESDFALELATVLAIPLDEFNTVIHQVQLAVYEKRKASFKPSLEIVLSGRPSPLFAAGFFIPLELPKNLEVLSFEEEIEEVFKAYKQDQIKKFNDSTFYIKANGNYEAFVKNINSKNLAEIPMGWAFGNGFKYFRAFEDTLHFNRLGKLINRTSDTKYTKGQLTIKGRDILSIF